MNYDYTMHMFPAVPLKIFSWYNQRSSKKTAVLERELSKLNEHCKNPLRWRKKNGKVYFLERINGKQHGITSDMSRVYALARHDYLSHLLNDLHSDNEDVWRNKLTSLLSAFESVNLDMRRILFTPRQYKWASKPQSQNRKYTEALKYKTRNGVLVRSKSEQIIGNILEEFCISYRYEPEMIIDNRVFHPDFVIMMPDGRLIILEHLGRMDLDSYVKSNIERLRAYNCEDMLIGRDVFLSFEADIQNQDRIVDLIKIIMAS